MGWRNRQPLFCRMSRKLFLCTIVKAHCRFVRLVESLKNFFLMVKRARKVDIMET
jgi:hypothetical protein